MKESCTYSIFGFTFRECENECNVNHSNYAFIYNLKLSTIPQHSNERCCLIEDSNSISKVHQRSAFCFGSHGDLTVLSLVFVDLSTAAHMICFFFEQKQTPESFHFDVHAS